MNGHTYELFKNIFNDFLTESKGGINMLKHSYSNLCFDTISVERLKSMFLIDFTTVFYHQRM